MDKSTYDRLDYLLSLDDWEDHLEEIQELTQQLEDEGWNIGDDANYTKSPQGRDRRTIR